MKKFYFMLVSLVLMVTTTNAQIEKVQGFFGKWQMEAQIDVVDTQYKDLLKGSCEVVIEQGENGFPAQITGFCGSAGTLLINNVDLTAQTLLYTNPNSPCLWESSSLSMSDETGKYPYGTAAGGWSDTYGSINFTYDAATGVLSYPDFTLVTVNHKEGSAEVKVKVSNIKMTLKEAAVVEIADIAGEWHYTPYYADNDSTFVKEFDMTLVAKDETNKNWTATFNFEGYAPFTLDAAFDGVGLSIPFDNLYLDAENKIRFGIGATASTLENVFVKNGKFTFSYNSKTLMYQGDAIYIRQEGTKTEIVDGEEVTTDEAPLVQRLRGGWITREDPNAIDWSGTYKVKVGENDVRYVDETAKLPSEFDIVVVADKGEYYVTDFLGYNMYESWLPDLKLVIGEDGKSASIEKGSIYTERDNNLIEGTLCIIYHNLVGDAADGSISLTINEDGTFSLGSFSLVKHAMNTNDGSAVWEEDQTVARYKPLVINKAAEEEAPAFDWAGTYVLTGEVTKADAEDTTECPASFEVVVEYDEEGAYYCVMEIMGNDAWSINSGQFELTVAEDGKSATLNNGNVYSYGKGYFLKMFDANAQKNPVKVTLNDDNTLSIDDFSIVYGFYDDTELKTIAYYKNVTISKKDDADTSIEEVAADAAVEGIFDMQGRRIDEIAAPGLYIVNGKKVLVK